MKVEFEITLDDRNKFEAKYGKDIDLFMQFIKEVKETNIQNDGILHIHDLKINEMNIML